ncbi:hypothetical protein Pla123a_37760 [Posidoniimonas polymericola]|uniref:Uncharacterized protein n=1 Tax=Posidoniimonas polymericola TaxID=2528002 RepID=A0A5C5YG24_9BACT|nr:hypothetical protein [Posidoniimonas polymericola]TWT73441.1 hypothetical protein Pla123a_37760 [Posidoniimonas polymericola]
MTNAERIRRYSQKRRRRAALVARRRRGVLLLIVLSILVMFMLVGTAFVLTGSNSLSSAKADEKAHVAAPQQADLLDRALRQVLRDTHDRNSAVRYHSLLRDAYGTDGFVGVVLNEEGLRAPQPARDYVSAAAVANPTQGQLIDIFVRDLDWATTPSTELTNDYVVALETDENGLPVDYTLSRTNGYFNGCLLTLLDGPAKGQSVRVIDYEYLGEQGNSPSHPDADGMTFRLRVMAIPRADGQPLRLDLDHISNPNVSQNDLAGHSFMVNGRPFNGSGVGLNLLSDPSGARLTAAELMGTFGLAPVALSPHARYFTSIVSAGRGLGNNLVGYTDAGATYPLGVGGSAAAADSLYKFFVGPGGSDESYDAPDFQNMFLASNPLRPRPRGRVVDPSTGDFREVADYYAGNNAPAPARLELDGLPIPSFHRPALVNYWLHQLMGVPWLSSLDVDVRAKAILKPYNDDGTVNGNIDAVIASQIVAFKRKYMLRPLIEDHPNFTGGNPFASLTDADLAKIQGFVNGANITFPSFEVAGPWDVDNDGDGVADSIWVDLGMPVQKTEDGRLYKPLFAIMVQDLDGRLNLNAHGSLAHLASIDDMAPGVPVEARKHDVSTGGGVSAVNLAGGLDGASNLASSDLLPHGSGWGPADISLRSVMSPTLAYQGPGFIGDTTVDDYARVLKGRPALPPAQHAAAYQVGETWGRYGAGVTSVRPEAGVPFYVDPNNFASTTVNPNTIDVLAKLEKQGYPLYSPAVGALVPASNTSLVALGARSPSGFSTAPDLKGAFAVGLDYTGQPVHEAQHEASSLYRARFKPMLLTIDSPYELDLMNHTRQDSVADLLTVTAGYGTAATIDDDAPFAPGELERILRSLDVDADRLPDRLWNLVDAFDPAKLAVQTVRYGNAGNAGANTSGVTISPGQLLQAQIEAATRRRSVTTESFDMPTTNEDWTARLVAGADGLPGTGVFPQSDDYTAVMLEPVPPQARLVDYLRYRIVLELKRQDPNTFAAAMPASDPRLVQAVNLILDGGAMSTDEIASMRTGTTPQARQDYQRRASFGGLLAPEVMAGLKMDINRPFGDGVDNNNNGIVDEPFEAGDTWTADANGNREEYRDLDGDNEFDPSLDKSQNRSLAAVYPFDYTYGKDANGRGAYLSSTNGRIHDDAPLARQLYARHLYCLAMLLTDENYLMPFDKRDAQVLEYLDPDAGQNNGSQREPSMAWKIAQQLQNNPPLGYPGPGDTGDPKVDARRLAWRKLTCRRIAQWAINCADMRDPDAICTAFEYDENPWDGWNVVDRANNRVYSIDGEPNTDENLGQYRDLGGRGRGGQAIQDDNDASPLDQTRGIVWGMERPELLLTETFATHDRRTEDLEGFGDENPNAQPGTENELLAPSDPNVQADDDMDQRLRPLGTLFVEVYNPNSLDIESPAELSREFIVNYPNSNPVASDRKVGIALDRLSAITDGDGKYSPVWRMIVVEEDPRLRNDRATWDNGDYNNYESLSRVPSLQQLATQIDQGRLRPVASDPDFPTFDPLKVPEYRADVNGQLSVAKQKTGAYIERTVYFTTGGDDRPPIQRDPEDLRVRIPIRYAEFPIPNATATPGLPNLKFNMNEWLLWPEGNKMVNGKLRVYDYHFPPADIDGDGSPDPDPLNTAPRNRHQQFAPILPGRYAVIGTAGYQYSAQWNSNNKNPEFGGRFITPFGRSFESARQVQGGFENQPVGRMRDDTHHRDTLKWTRRFDLMPNPNPEIHQFAIMHNGGPESRFISEPENSKFNRNVTNPPYQFDLNPATQAETVGDLGTKPSAFGVVPPNNTKRKIQPVVSIPIEGLSISTPLDGYLVRMLAIDRSAPARWAPNAAYGEGALFQDPQKGPVDQPFDLEEHLIKNVTTPNFRSVHLQRLADPMLPWNPVNTTHAQHNPSLPVNPYITVDSESVDLTAFNGVDPQDPAPLNQNAPAGRPEGLVHMTMASLQRGGYEAAVTDPTQLPAANSPVDVAPNVARAIWAREPVRVSKDISNGTGVSSSALGPGQFAYQYYDASGGQEPQPSQGFIGFMNLDSKLVPGETGGPKRVPMVLNVPLRTTLGFANGFFPSIDGGRNIAEPYTPFYSSNARFDQDGDKTLEPDSTNYHDIDINGDGIPGDLIGAPWTERTVDNTTQDDNTYPWLAWNNRPYASALELMQVPASTAGSLGKEFSVFSAGMAVVPNPYNGAIGDLSDSVNNNDARQLFQNGQFGHLLNLFNTSSQPAAAFNQNSGSNMLELLPSGAANLHRLTSYLRAPSRFVATQTAVNPEVFNVVASRGSTTDPRNGLLAPFNRVDQYREPGRVNLNTVAGILGLPEGGERDSWSPVYDGLMHRYHDRNLPSGRYQQPIGHRGPAWRDVVRSRRGYLDPGLTGATTSLVDVSPMALNPLVPTFFGNPFREPEEGQLVPLASMVHAGAEASLLRSHPYSPASSTAGDAEWGNPRSDDASVSQQADGTPIVAKDRIDDDPGEAGIIAGTDTPLFNPDGTALGYNSDPTMDAPRAPLFSAGTTETGLNSERNAALRYMPLTRMSSLATTRSGAFAIWITVGFFEVEPAPDWVDNDNDQVHDTRFVHRDLYDRIYPDGYQLGKELGSDTGDTNRHRGFWIVDRTLPVAFRPGDDVNLEKMILLRREIE